MKQLVISPEDYLKDIGSLAGKIKFNRDRALKENSQSDADNLPFVFSIGRGGWFPGSFIAHELGMPMFPIQMAAYDKNNKQTPAVSVIGETKGIAEFIRHFFKSYNKLSLPTVLTVYIVDDLLDTGRTFEVAKSYVKEMLAPKITPSTVALELFTCSVYNKNKKIKPDFCEKELPENEWVVFPYD